MHDYIISASIQLLPITQDRHAYDWVDEAIAVIQKSGIKFEVGPFATVVEGTYAEVMAVLLQVNDYLVQQGCAEWITSVQLQMRSSSAITAGEKTEKYQ